MWPFKKLRDKICSENSFTREHCFHREEGRKIKCRQASPCKKDADSLYTFAVNYRSVRGTFVFIKEKQSCCWCGIQRIKVKQYRYKSINLDDYPDEKVPFK